MSQEKQGKKMSPAEKSLAGKDDKIIPVKPTDLSDADLDNVAGGTYWQGQILSGAVSIGAAVYTKTVPVPLTPAPK